MSSITNKINSDTCKITNYKIAEKEDEPRIYPNMGSSFSPSNFLTDKKVQKVNFELKKVQKDKIPLKIRDYGMISINGSTRKDKIKSAYDKALGLYKKSEYRRVVHICSKNLYIHNIFPTLRIEFMLLLEEAKSKISYTEEQSQIKQKLDKIQKFADIIIERLKDIKSTKDPFVKQQLTQLIILNYIKIGNERTAIAYIYRCMSNYEKAREEFEDAENIFNEAKEKKIIKPDLKTALFLSTAELYIDKINFHEKLKDEIMVIQCYFRAKEELATALSCCEDESVKNDIEMHLKDLKVKYA